MATTTTQPPQGEPDPTVRIQVEAPSSPPSPPSPSSPSSPPSPPSPPSGGGVQSYYDPMSGAPEGWEQTKAPAGWQQRAWDDLMKSRHRTRAAETALAEAEEKRLEAETKAAKVEELERQIATQQARHRQDLVFMELGGNFGHPQVKRMARREYQDHLSEQKQAGIKDEDLPDFEAWITSEETKSSPLFAPHYPDATVDDALPEHEDVQDDASSDEPQRGGKRTGTVQRHTAPKVEWTDAKIALSRSRGRWRGGRVGPDGKLIGGSPDWRSYMEWRGRQFG